MPESPPTTGATQKRSSQEMEVEEADKSLGNAVPPVKRDKKDQMDVDGEAAQPPRKSPKKSAKKDNMEIDATEKTLGESPDKATNSVEKDVKKEVNEKSIESDEGEKTTEKSSSKTPVKKTRKKRFPYSKDNEEDEEEELPAKAPAKKDTKDVDYDFLRFPHERDEDEEEEGEESPSETRATRAATAKLKIADEFVSEDEDTAERAKSAAAKPSDEKEVERPESAWKEFTKKWRNQTMNMDVEQPIPQMHNPEHFCWYDLTEDWNELILPLAIPTNYVDTKFKYGVEGFVPLPFSDPQTTKSIGTSSRPRGRLIAEALNSFANGVRDLQHLEAGIRTYWKDFEAKTLKKMFSGASAELKKEYLSTITGIAKIARRSSDLVTKPLPALEYEGDVKSVSMSQEQAACLLAYAFFCSVMPRHKEHFNHFTFHRFHMDSSLIEKMKFILFYFKTVIDEMPRGTLTFSRQEWIGEADEREGFDKWKDPLSDMIVLSEGLIEEMEGCLHVDFANAYIGGGVMNHGAVQEEIRFLCCPEMLVSLMLCDKMEPTEAILIQGAQQYSAYTGYSSTLKHQPLKLRRDEPRDFYGRARSYLVAIDAICFNRRTLQYQQEFITRETKKAYVGFMRDKEAPARPIATGNWGCGAFNGDKELKSLIQLVAASKAGRPLIYITFMDAEFAEGLKQIMERITECNLNNGQLYKLLMGYLQYRRDYKQGVFSFIRDALQSGSPF